ncbi:MAG: [protein-PII] uridylyltransferase [Acidobacteria bacterium RIFCSPLOWO2_12_FULL_59_11]|nr:MAG: [protein-PII] uridylyltransferase [Acidobacteria bacterium RIFCSPLOWO2_12_FULL_59_11]
MKPEPEKILDRAEEHLRELPQASGEETLSLLRGFLRMESHRLRMLHRYGLGGLEVAAGRAQVVDAIITHVYRLTLERYRQRPAQRGDPSAAAIVAVGGYGRGELCPHSDVDLLILYDRSSVEFGRFLASELIYLLWDIGLKVGHSWRTPELCLEMARSDSTAENSLLDARLLIGGQEGFATLRALLHRHWTKAPQAFVERKRAELEERYGKLGETVFLLEPNLKESPGGLRDFHAVLWLARGAWRMEGGEGLVKAGVLSDRDGERARRSYDWILRVRNELHYLTDRRADQLTFALQPEVAAGLHFGPSKHLRPTEVFMQQYFQHAQNVHQALRLVLAAALHQKGKRRRQVLLEWTGGFHLIKTEGELRLAESGRQHFPSSPLDMMRVGNLSQKLRLRLGEDIQHAIRNNLSTVRRQSQRQPEMSASFLEMLRRPGRVGPALRALHTCGLLGKYIPEFGRITRLMQHDYYHSYTTDEHTLRAIERLDEIWRNPPPGMERYKDLTCHISDPAPLYLGVLLHDVGKGLGGGHSEKGAQRAAAVCERLALEPKKTAQVELLVRHHLLLSHLSQRRDFADRRMAQQAAEVAGDLETLSMLCLLTYADTAAVSPDVWNEWKNAMLWELFNQVRAQFLGLEAATAQEEQQLREIRASIQELLQSAPEPEVPEAPLSAAIARRWMEEHLALLPHRYPLGYRPELVARQILLAQHALRSGPAAALLPVPQEGYTLLLLCCPDTPGLFARVAGALAALEVNILGARLDTRKDGMAVDVLWISTPQGNVISDPFRMRRIGNTVEGVLRGTLPFDELVSRIRSQPLGPVTKPPQLSLNNEISEACTVLEVLAEDRLGLAYSIAKTLSALGLNIVFAKLATEKTMAFDVFYLTDWEGRKIPEDRWEGILSHLETALQMPEPLSTPGH